MKKWLFLVVICIACSCTNDIHKPNIVEYTNNLIKEYPNYRSNEIAKDSVLNTIATRKKSIEDLNDVKFKFVKLIENETSGGKVALFISQDCCSDIENPNSKPKYLITDINMRVLGSVSDEVSVSLDSNVPYHINGKLHAWDAEDKFNITHRIGEALDFGTYIIDNIIVKPVKQ